MKKLLLVIFIALVVLLAAAGLAGKFIYDSVDESTVPYVSAGIFGAELTPESYHYRVAVLGGLVYKDFVKEEQGSRPDIGELTEITQAVILSAGYEAAFELFFDGEFVSSGAMRIWDEELYAEPGDYELLLTLEKPEGNREDYGIFSFGVRFTVPYPEPEFLTGSTTLRQGEIFVVKLTNVVPEVKPYAETNLGMSVFTATGPGDWFCAIPIGNTRAAGNYNVIVNAGIYEWETMVAVKPYDFSTQNLIIDTSNPVIIEANSPAAYAQFREKIPPLYETYDENIYWSGLFRRPAIGRLTTDFGAIRYTNSNWSNPRHHWGVDIAADTGTPVVAPNNGKVIFAEYLLNTGNTAAIEHGGGFKSFYYHMDSLNINVGDMVEKGALIGSVGSTGYSTGPHLHFEMRIGNQAVNPLMLFEDSASLYALE